MSTTQIPQHKFESLTFPPYDITYDRLTNQLSKVFSPSDLREYLNLYELAQKKPKEAKKPVEELLDKSNHLSEVYNLLGYIYVQLKKIRKAESLIQKNYEHNPENLFAKINYADQCLRRGKTSKIPEIFKQQNHLSSLYPDRKTFHYSEVLGFSTLMGFYYLKTGDREKAKDYCIYAKMIDPEDITVQYLTKKLYQKSFLAHFLQQFYKKKS
ncbi:MAG: hypothetical protein S4CHLAM7_12960 [Chlamydiae bacterium]|nr:hypothetical protein [Chlamydiota bacterium]